MEYKWSLKELYEGFETDKFQNDFKKLKEEIKKFNEFTKEAFKDTLDAKNKLETYISMVNSFSKYSVLSAYSFLRLSVNAKDMEASKYSELLDEQFSELTSSDYFFVNFLKQIDNLDDLISESKVLKEHEFYLTYNKTQSKYLLSEKEELLMAKLKITGSTAWEKQRDYLTSVLPVKIKDEIITLSECRNLAYDKNQDTRKKAYEAELESYKQIDSSIAFALNSIKGEVLTNIKLRGYETPLEMTILDSQMDKQTLDALISSMEDYLPVFRKFYKKKAELLGHKEGLPFYDLFAPVGDIDLSFTYEEAKNYIIDNFTKFSKKLGDYAKKAFENSWIDVKPLDGKAGGAFCYGLHPLRESRILTNFTGSFDNVLTLAHELGHGYHGECLNDATYLNSDYSMPIAETASTMCETIIIRSALSKASKEEEALILENYISGILQTIVDIYSRFLFERELFEKRKEGSLSVEELNELMISSQKKAYGDGLSHKYLHPYMWICKTHYYNADANFYNFPYAYGQLFSTGLYNLYLQKGDEFIKQYDDLLLATGKNNLRDIGKIINIETRSKEFWISSLKLIEKDIEKFIALDI